MRITTQNISTSSASDDIITLLYAPLQKIGRRVKSNSRCRDRDAEDIAGDGVAYLLEHLEELRTAYDPDRGITFANFLLAKAEGWMRFTVQKETARNQRRVEGSHDVAQRASVIDDEAIQAIDDADEAEALLGHIDDKNSQGREIVERTFGLHGREQQSGIEIADDLGCSPGTVSKVKQRALREIQKAIEDEADSPPS